MCASTTSPSGSSGGGSSRAIAAGSVRQATVRIDMSRKPIGKGGTSGASQGEENGPAAAAASLSSCLCGGAPRQLATRVPRDRVPVPVDTEAGAVRDERPPVDDLE